MVTMGGFAENGGGSSSDESEEGGKQHGMGFVCVGLLCFVGVADELS